MRSAITLAAALLFSIAAPAGADAVTYCVHAPAGCSGTAAATVQDALAAANGVQGTDAIQVGTDAMPAGGFSERFDDASGNPVTITGVGGPILVATSDNGSTVRDPGTTVSGIHFKTNGAENSVALRLFDGLATQITAETVGNPFSTTGVILYGGALRSSQVTVGRNTTTYGVDVEGAASVTDTVVQGARTGVVATADATLDRLRLKDVTNGVQLFHIQNTTKTVTLSNSSIEITGNGGTALETNGSSSGGSTVLNAQGVTVVVAPGPSSTFGARVSCLAANGTSTINLRDTYLDDQLSNSVVRDDVGGTCSQNNLRLGITYSAYEPNGQMPTTESNNVNNAGLAPGFVDRTGQDYRLLATSPLVDKGSSIAPALGETDLGAAARLTGSARDIGAYEYQPPTTTPGTGTGSGGTTGGAITAPPSSSVTQRPTPSADTTKPTLTGLSFSPTKFKAATSGASTSAKTKVGTKVSFSLSEPSSVRFTAERKTSGRRVGSKCKAKTKSNSKKRACSRYVKVSGSFVVTGKAGRNTFTFRGRIGGKRLRPGTYRLSGQATDAARNRSTIKQKTFAVVR